MHESTQYESAHPKAEIRVPDCGPGTAIHFVCWLVDDSENVSRGERIGELLASGVVIEFAAPAAGVLHHQPLSPREQVRQGQLLATIEPDNTSAD